MTVLAASVREEVADFLAALVLVYTILLIAWIVLSLVLALGARIPYARWSSAVIAFLGEVSEPYLRIFRRLGLRIGPFDLSPMVAILVLQIGGGLIVAAVHPA